MRYHILKTWPEYFAPIIQGKKKFEYRRNDRDYQVGDILYLREYDANAVPGAYTGRQATVKVTYILSDGFGLPEGHVIMSFKLLYVETEI